MVAHEPVSTAPAPISTPMPPAKPRLLQQLRDVLRLKHYSIRTEQAYLDWIHHYILFHGKRHPKDMGADEAVAFRPTWPYSATWPPPPRTKRSRP